MGVGPSFWGPRDGRPPEPAPAWVDPLPGCWCSSCQADRANARLIAKAPTIRRSWSFGPGGGGSGWGGTAAAKDLITDEQVAAARCVPRERLGTYRVAPDHPHDAPAKS